MQTKNQDQHPPKELIEELLHASAEVAKQIGFFAAIGVTVGFFVLAAYSIPAHTVPEFGGDEWIPQLAKLGGFCGLMVALLTFTPAVDLWFYTSLFAPKRASGTSAKSRPSADESLRARKMYVFAGWHFLWELVVGFIFVGLLALITHCKWPAPWMLVAPAIGILGIVALIVVRTKSKKWGISEWVEALVQAGSVHVSGVAILLVLLLILHDRFQIVDDKDLWWFFPSVVAGHAVYRLVVVGAFSYQNVRARLVLAAALTLGIACFFSPTVVRIAGLANLPNTRIALERGTACVVARHLDLSKSHVDVICVKPADGALDTYADLEIDVVSRVGAQYTVAASGVMRQKPKGACNNVQGGAKTNQQSPDNPPYACVDIPRDAIKLTLR